MTTNCEHREIDVDEDETRTDDREPISSQCPSHPHGDRTHECMINELRCVYCAQPLEPLNCYGCGQFVPTENLNEGIWRCDDCA